MDPKIVSKIDFYDFFKESEEKMERTKLQLIYLKYTLCGLVHSLTHSVTVAIVTVTIVTVSIVTVTIVTVAMVKVTIVTVTIVTVTIVTVTVIEVVTVVTLKILTVFSDR